MVKKLAELSRACLGALMAVALVSCGNLSPTRPHTAGSSVTVLDAPFTIQGLDRQRTIRLYLPPSYASRPDKRYPVIYMHDGQNLFDDATSYAGEWGVDETLDDMARRTGFEAIVVGIDNGGEHRMQELNPFDHPQVGPGEGRLYLQFIVKSLKPWVDSHYRTLTDTRNTAVIGSSMGGLISEAAIREYPDIFGRAGVMSPAYWPADPGIYREAAAHPLAPGARVYFSMGDAEGDDAIPPVQRMYAMAAAQRPEPGAVTLHIIPGAIHRESAWRVELPTVIQFLFAP